MRDHMPPQNAQSHDAARLPPCREAEPVNCTGQGEAEAGGTPGSCREWPLLSGRGTAFWDSTAPSLSAGTGCCLCIYLYVLNYYFLSFLLIGGCHHERTWVEGVILKMSIPLRGDKVPPLGSFCCRGRKEGVYQRALTGSMMASLVGRFSLAKVANIRMSTNL